jgi:transglutaminase-like putative cysteine protease
MGAKLMRTPMRSCPSCKFTLNPRLFIRSLLFLAPICLASFVANAQKFPATSIPDSLKENTDVVTRLNEITWDIKAVGEATRKMHEVYTILNEKGDRFAEYFSAVYNLKSTQINSISGYLYDAGGKEIKHFKKKDMEDHPYEDGSSFVNDERYKKGGFSYNNYPYTVEFEEEDDINGFMSVGSWKPQTNLRSSVELSKFNIVTPADYAISYRMLNSTIKPEIAEEKGNKKSYSWQIRNLVSYDEMPFSADFVMYSPHLLIALSDIKLEGYSGNMGSWNEFAKFYGSLQKGRDVLPEETKQKVHELTTRISDPATKVAVLYNYLQQNSHYVNVQLGIGGWQASEATYVATKKYGDCKALSNFMVALLKEAGIKGHAVVIRGGERTMDFVTDFTNDPFNHVICCVPLEKDTIWLECTDQFLPPGYLSSFTANRYGLFIDDNGGSLVHTPAYLLPDNTRMRRISAVLDKEGNLTMECNTSYRALCQDHIEGTIHHWSKEEQLNSLKSKFSLPTYDVNSFNYTEDYSKRLPVIHESLQLSVKDYAQITGKRLFINPDILSRSAEKYAEDKNRKLDIELKEEYRYSDSVQISIPAGYEMESRSTDLELKTKFGKYMNRMVVSNDKIMYYRVMEQYSGRFPAKDYTDVVKFYNDIYDADHTSIVLVKKN